MTRYTHTFDDLELYQDRPGVIARPPWVALAFLVAGAAIDLFAWAPHLYEPVQYLGGAGMIIAGGSLMAAAMRSFREAGTPVETWRATEAVVMGPYAHTRNPVYVAMILIYCGIGVITNTPAIVALAPALFAVLHYGVVRREEHYLECKFGEAYLHYARSVPRWV